VLGLSTLGVVLLGWLIGRARWRGDRRPILARLGLLCIATLFGLVLLETSAAAWQAWIHRLPSLPGRISARETRPRRPVWAPRIPDHPPTLPEQFSEPAQGDAVSLVVIGESSALGYPFNPKLSIGQIVAWQLQQALPGRRVDLNVLAQSGATLEAMHHRLAELKRRPDALIVYCGHNEFQSRYEWSRIVPAASAVESASWLDRLERRSPLCRLIQEQISRNRLDAPPPLRTRQLVDWPVCSPSEYASILADFRRRLEAIVVYCEQLGTLPILVIPPANDRGFEPSRSVLPDSASLAEREAVSRAIRAARSAESDPSRAMDLYRTLIARYPGFAEAHFRLARLLEQAGDWSAAGRHYVLARDADALPLRCPTAFQEVYREVAAQHDCLLIEGPAVLRSLSPHTILGDDLFHDAHHPALLGHMGLSEAVLSALRARQAFGWRSGPAPFIDAAECAKHFQLGQADWFTVCERSSEFYRYTASARYDPVDRMSKSRRFSRAAQLIQEGAPPEETDIPGLGCRPRQSPKPRE
jgi:hypothetical protein